MEQLKYTFFPTIAKLLGKSLETTKILDEYLGKG